MLNSFELFKNLLELEHNLTERDPYWWPHSGSFEVIVGVMLTQQTKWENVEKSIENLRCFGLLSLQKIAELEIGILAEAIRPSGFYNQKSVRLKALCRAIYEEYGDFDSFLSGVDREWLLSQKGVGLESADSILLYACRREIMVVDAYTARMLRDKCAMEAMEYEEIREWLEGGIYADEGRACELAGGDIVKVFSLFHGAIVEYSKKHTKKGLLGGPLAFE
ncbi:MAG: 3-methyladenine DNA glycosylase [Campylobacterales bacterium]